MSPTDRPEPSRLVARWCLLIAAGALILAACSAKGSYQAMAQEPRYETYEGSPDLPNGASVQPLEPGVVARGHLQDDTVLYAGLTANGTPSEVFPFPITRAILARGQAEYNAYCTPCHDYAGTGHGEAVKAGFAQPPDLSSEALRSASVGLIFATITNGFHSMPAYSSQIAVADRWAIVAYVRALQLSQHATLDDVPANMRSQIEPSQPAVTP
jgi:mono/diheme cytochrome c family protein